MSQLITLEDKIVQAEGNLVSNMDQDKVMMSIQSGKYYNLGAIGGRIWDLIEKPLSVQQLVDILAAEYEIGQGDCEEQVLGFLEQLRAEQLIKIGDDSAA